MRLEVDSAGGSTLFVGGQSLPITSSHISPDRRTVIVYWASGEGTFVRSDDGAVVASLFDKTFPVRVVRLERLP